VTEKLRELLGYRNASGFGQNLETNVLSAPGTIWAEYIAVLSIY
jgi:hypothetical protein